MRLLIASVLALFPLPLPGAAQTLVLSKSIREFVRVDAPTVALTHVRAIDGTGDAPIEDRNVIIDNGKILAIEGGSEVVAPAGTSVVDLRGYTVIPGIVGMHNHLASLPGRILTLLGSLNHPGMMSASRICGISLVRFRSPLECLRSRQQHSVVV